MKPLTFFNLFVLLCISSHAQYKYPVSKTVDSSSTWHKITVHDPYRWLEDLKNPDVIKWFKDQNDYTDAALKKLPLTDEIYNEYIKIDKIQPDKIGKIRQVGTTLFYFNDKIEDPKPKLYYRIGESGKETLLAESNMWGNDFHISNYEIDPYQKYLVITAAAGGSEISIAKFYDIEHKQFLKDSIPGVFAGFAPGAGNIFYAQQPTWDIHAMVDEKDKSVNCHHLGTDTTQDKVYLSYQTNPELYSTDNSFSLWPVWVDIDAKYELILASSVAPYAELYFRKLNSSDKWKKIISVADELTTFNGKGNKLFYICKKNAPNGKVMFMDMNNPDIKKVKMIVPEKETPLESSNGLMQSANYLIIPYMKNGVKMHHEILDMRTNKLSPNPFPESTNLMYITPFNKNNDDVHIVRSGWTTPLTYTYSNLEKPFSKEKTFSFRKNAAYPFTNEVTVDEIEIAGYDGVLIPVSIIHRKDAKLNGKNVAYVNSYGAYGYSSAAGFNPEYLMMASKGVVIAIPHVRGGGEKGENWHLSGFKQNKCNTWKDLNSTAEYLINKGYTTAAQLACEGGSAGGILIGRAVTERPDLWACAIPQVGCLNPVRMEFSPNGPINTPEFGTVNNINEFFALMEMDALLHVQKGTKYPAMMITTGWNDPRVISWQPGKFAAAVQAANTSDKPILLQVDYDGGHWSSKDKFAGFKKEARRWAFILEQTGFRK